MPVILTTQEDCSWMSAYANSLGDYILKNPFTKKKLVDWLKMYALKSSPRNHKKETISSMFVYFITIYQ
jgi:hypothetical protein